jgi:hypothetical protein
MYSTISLAASAIMLAFISRHQLLLGRSREQ